MIEFNKQPGQRILELGGGETRHPQVDCNVDLRQVEGVDFAADFNEPLPMKDNEWDAIYCAYTLEHISFHKTKDFLREVCRICKPGGRAIFITPNTEKQIEWINENSNGWDNEDLFTSASKVLFGGQNHVGNFHSAYLDPMIMVKLLNDAGFCNVNVSPCGARNTDMATTADKPASKVVIPPAEKTVAKHVRPIPVRGVPLWESLQPEVTEQFRKAADLESKTPISNVSREKLFNFSYFNGGKECGGYAHEGYSDFPCHWTTAKKILERSPKSVVELGACKGMILKRILDQGIPGVGLEISKHCYLTRVTNAVQQQDLCAGTWGPFPDPKPGEKPFDLAYSAATFEHIPEEYLPIVLSNLRNISCRGLHGIDFGEADSGFDKTHCLLKNFSWWRSKFDEFGLQSHEIVNKEVLEDQKYFPQEVLQSTNGFKINLGCGLNQFWHGWINVDAQDLSQWSAGRGHAFFKHDIKNGLAPFGTAGVDAIFLVNILEFLDYNQSASLLREARRIIKPNGQLRISVNNAAVLSNYYTNSDIGEGYDLSYFDEYSESVAKAKTTAQKLHALLYQGKQSIYDWDALYELVLNAGFKLSPDKFSTESEFRWKAETMDSAPDLNLFATAVPIMGI